MDNWGGYSSWSKDLLREPFLVTPIRLLWRAYKEHCFVWGFDPAEPSDFVHWLRGEEGVEVKTGGRGRIRRVAVGVAPSMVLEGSRDTQNDTQEQFIKGRNQ